MTQQERYVYPGALHIHTTYSDGSGTVEEVITAAHEAGLRWIMITDHDTLDGRHYEGWHEDVLLLVNHEITPLKNHFLALEIDEVIDRQQPTQAFIDNVYGRGGFGIIAHPDDHLVNKDEGVHPWDDWAVNWPGNATAETSIGIEIWNMMADWRSNRNRIQRPQHLTNLRAVSRGPTDAVMRWWDSLNAAGKRVFAIGGLDAHAFRLTYSGTEYTVFPYVEMFGTVTNYLILNEPLPQDDSRAACALVHRALRTGRSYIVNRMYGTQPAIPLLAPQNYNEWTIGDSPILAAGPLAMVADVGGAADLRLLCNGEIVAQGNGSLERAVDRPGAYRLEAYREGLPWLYTNPIYVRGA